MTKTPRWEFSASSRSYIGVRSTSAMSNCQATLVMSPSLRGLRAETSKMQSFGSKPKQAINKVSTRSRLLRIAFDILMFVTSSRKPRNDGKITPLTEATYK